MASYSRFRLFYILTMIAAFATVGLTPATWAQATSLIDLVQSTERDANSRDIAAEQIPFETRELIKALIPYRRKNDLMDPSTKQVLTLEGVHGLEQRLKGLFAINQKMALEIRSLTAAVIGTNAKTIVREVQLACTGVIGCGFRVGVIAGIEDRGDSSRIIAGLNIYIHVDPREQMNFCGLLAGLDLSFEQFVCDQTRLSATETRRANVVGMLFGRSVIESEGEFTKNFADVSSVGLFVGIGASFPKDSSYSRIAIPVFWMPFGWASGLQSLIKKQRQILEAIAQFQIMNAFDLSEELERKIHRFQRRAVDRGYTIGAKGSLSEPHPFASYQSLLQIILEKQSVCASLIVRK